MIVLENTPSAVLVLAVGVLCGTGVYLLLERPLTRILLGFILISNGVNLMLLVAGGRAGASPIVGSSDEPMSDPLAQAMTLTAIVITLGLTAFILALAYRSWQLHGHDEVADDVEDRRVARHAALNAPAYEDADADETGQTLDEEAAAVHDDVAGDEAPGDEAPGDDTSGVTTPGEAR
ncbi:Na(+)/H(+) antiporter subunit C [Isoptericola sp. 178]|uniref:Na(+)/H(+) antiporter subunit C n=1 Tax=Isoptericola sp. 178 TaxID=3064651 RepID=UPI0027142CA1|nr:Na(+)/H(+) antiporter subunit C [Isoptericola sp. 178]MDO8143501.1 Na(+)/H(+) antiporter subunit C [Isoptericola sp. 178]